MAAVTALTVVSGGLYLLLQPNYIEGSPVSEVLADVRAVATTAEMFTRDLNRVPESKESLYQHGYLVGDPEALGHIILVPETTNSVIIKYDGPAIGTVTADVITSNSRRRVEIRTDGTVFQSSGQ